MGVIRRTLDLAGSARSYLIVTPPPGERPSAVVLSLHGSTSTAGRQRLLSGMDRLAGSGAVVVYPEAYRRRRGGFVWDPSVDAPFLEALITSLVTEFDPVWRRPCLSGMSGGARMSCALAWSRPDLVGAVGAVAGVRSGAGPGPDRPVPVIAFHGTADRINPYGGGNDARWDVSVPEAVAGWATANGVPDGPVVTALSPTLTRTSYGDGTAGEVVLWTSTGAGHTWPGGRLPLIGRLFLGRTTSEIDATSVIWAFYRSHAGDR